MDREAQPKLLRPGMLARRPLVVKKKNKKKKETRDCHMPFNVR